MSPGDRDGLSLLYWSYEWTQRSARVRAATGWFRHLLGLDGVLLFLLAGWVVFMTGVFVNVPDPMRQQPLEPVVELRAMVREWPRTLTYLWQFGALASMLYSQYWVNRYVLVRRVLAVQGVVPYALWAAVCVMVSSPVLATLAARLPLNVPEATLLPSADANPFDPLNLQFMVMLWALATPLILAFERQQAGLQMAELRHGTVQAELRVLQQQVNPHFLFNTLNSLYALCLTAPDRAPDVVLTLADLLRYTAYEGQKDLAPLHREIAYLQNYLALQETRVHQRCRVSFRFDTPDPGVEIAPLLLIMLVENAFKHGVEPSEAPSDIDIVLTLDADSMTFVCSNSLPARPGPAGPGIGLENLRRRLEIGYPGRHRLASQEERGRWVACLWLRL